MKILRLTLTTAVSAAALCAIAPLSAGAMGALRLMGEAIPSTDLPNPADVAPQGGEKDNKAKAERREGDEKRNRGARDERQTEPSNQQRNQANDSQQDNDARDAAREQEQVKRQQREAERQKNEAQRQEDNAKRAEDESKRRDAADRANAEAAKRQQDEQQSVEDEAKRRDAAERVKAEAAKRQLDEQLSAEGEAKRRDDAERAKAEAAKSEKNDQQRAKDDAKRRDDADRAKADASKRQQDDQQGAKDEAKRRDDAERAKAENAKRDQDDQQRAQNEDKRRDDGERQRSNAAGGEKEKFERGGNGQNGGNKASASDQKSVEDVGKKRVEEAPNTTLKEIKSERRERREAGGKRLVIEEPNRTIIQQDNRISIDRNERDRLRKFTPNARVERGPGGGNVSVVERGDTKIYSETDEQGRLVRRYRRDRDGRENIIVDNRRRKRNFGRNIAIGAGIGVGVVAGAVLLDSLVRVPPPRVRITREKYILRGEGASDEDFYEALSAPPVDRYEDRYTLNEVLATPRLRDRMRRVDLDDITFAFGAWDIDPGQYRKLERLARAIKRVLRNDPNEVFLIEGHTDAVGSRVDNLTLSDRRAEAVAYVLTREFEIPFESLATKGYGEEYLKIATAAPERINRRAAVRRITPLLARDGGGPRADRGDNRDRDDGDRYDDRREDRNDDRRRDDRDDQRYDDRDRPPRY